MPQYFDQELIRATCPTVKENGHKCSWFLGDIPKVQPAQHNYLCSDCRQEWLVTYTPDSPNTLHFQPIPKGIPKNYEPDSISIVEK